MKENKINSKKILCWFYAGFYAFGKFFNIEQKFDVLPSISNSMIKDWIEVGASLDNAIKIQGEKINAK